MTPHHNSIRVHDCVQSVSDRQHRALTELLSDGLLNQGIRPAMASSTRLSICIRHIKNTTLVSILNIQVTLDTLIHCSMP